MEAAVSISQGVMGSLLEKLSSMLVDECARLKGVRGEIRSLRSELNNMHAVLQKYAMLEDPDVQVKAWTSEVRELAYDVEDCIDKFLQRVGRDELHGPGGIKEFFRKNVQRVKTLGSRHQIVGQIEELKARVVAVREQRTSYKLDDVLCSSSSHATMDPRLSALFAEGDQLVGVDGPRDFLVKLLVERDSGLEKHLQVFSIVGFGGLGKTTLANEVYCKIKAKFQSSAFVSMSQKPDMKKILKDVIRQLLPDKERQINEDVKTWEDGRLIAKIRELLQDKRYFIIIDDIWSTLTWGIIKCAFPENNNDSRIVTTTRIIDVARPPLKEEWEKVRKSIGIALEKHQSLEGMKMILSLSYNDLSHHLKTCLLYLSAFPEDYIIPRVYLAWKWIAEGFISKEHGPNLQEVAESYFYELINKNMIQPVAVGYDGKVHECRVHDIMLEFIISKACEENFVTVLDSQTVVASRHDKIRRLSIQYIDQKLTTLLAFKDPRQARSLTYFGNIKYLNPLVEFEALRVLDVYYCKGLEEYDLSNIDKLSQLKFLSLAYSGTSKIPAQIGKLTDLETLIVGGEGIAEFPPEIVRLTNLINLDTDGTCQTKIPDGIRNMRNLKWLSGFHICKSSANAVEELGMLTKLKMLEIWFDSGESNNIKRHEEMLFASLCKLGSNSLQSLHIYSTDASSLEFLDGWTPLPNFLQCFTMDTSYYYSKIPQWMVSVANLTHLDINVWEVTEENLYILGELPALLSLQLWSKAVSKERFTIRGSIGFPSLKEFIFVFKSDSSGIWGDLAFEKGAMPKLESLEVPFHVSMAKTHGFYLGIVHLPCLKYVKVTLVNDGAEDSDTRAATAAILDEADAHANNLRVTIINSS